MCPSPDMPPSWFIYILYYKTINSLSTFLATPICIFLCSCKLPCSVSMSVSKSVKLHESSPRPPISCQNCKTIRARNTLAISWDSQYSGTNMLPAWQIGLNQKESQNFPYCWCFRLCLQWWKAAPCLADPGKARDCFTYIMIMWLINWFSSLTFLKPIVPKPFGILDHMGSDKRTSHVSFFLNLIFG